MQDQRVTGFELSSVQEHLYAVSKGGAAFQCQSALLIEGPLDVPRLRAAAAQVWRRSANLRASFRLLAGRRRPLQFVQPAPQNAVAGVDLRGDDASAQDTGSQHYLCELREQPLDLDNDALARFHLLPLG